MESQDTGISESYLERSKERFQMGSKSIAVLVVVAGAVGIYLQSQGKFFDFLAIITESSDVSIGRFVIGFLVLVFVLSFLDDRDAMLLALIVLLGALLVNNREMGDQNVIATLLG